MFFIFFYRNITMFFYIYGHNYGRQTDALPQGASPDSGTEAVGLIFTRI